MQGSTKGPPECRKPKGPVLADADGALRLLQKATFYCSVFLFIYPQVRSMLLWFIAISKDYLSARYFAVFHL